MYRNSNTQMNDVFNNYKNLTITSIKISRDIIQATMGLLTTTIFSNFPLQKSVVSRSQML